MPAPYSLDLRQKVIEAYRNQEGSVRQLAKRFKLSKNTVSGFLRRFRETGTVHPKRREGPGNPPKVDQPGAQYLTEVLQREPDLTLSELCQRFEVHFGESISLSAMDRGLKKHQITRKKKTFYDPQKHSPRVKQRRLEYRVEVSLSSPEELIVLDEMGAVLNLTPAYGRAPQGQRAYGEKPTSQGERISTIGALSLTGVLPAMCFEGTLNGPVFLYYVEHFLWPHLRAGKVVILDNAAAHQYEEALEKIEQTGAKVVFLPPYHPELNPIEYAWSKIKNFLKKKAARTKEQLYEALSKALNIILPQNCQAYFKHCGLCP